LQKTHIWPHIDDFEIKVDGINIVQYASRWEVKSIMIYLKLLEWLFIEKKTDKKPVMIIDDLISELDLSHKEMLIEKIKYYQSFVSCIYEEQNHFNIII
jgi:DNA replication and repair protein RecF